MRITRIYTAQTLGSHSNYTLETDASRHLSRSLRLGVGDQLTLFNGEGGEYPAQITSISKKNVEVRTGEHSAREAESSLQIHLGIAISRGERMDWIVQKATELGVHQLTPLFTANTGVKLAGERLEKKQQHWQQVAVSACEQSGRNRLPLISAPAVFDKWLAETKAEKKFVLHHRAQENVTPGSPGSVALLVGPEGGLSAAEISAAELAGYQSLLLGPRILRTETAPLAAIAILQNHFGDMPIS